MAENSAGVAYSYGANLYVRGRSDDEMTVINVCPPYQGFFCGSVKCLDGRRAHIELQITAVLPADDSFW